MSSSSDVSSLPPFSGVGAVETAPSTPPSQPMLNTSSKTEASAKRTFDEIITPSKEEKAAALNNRKINFDFPGRSIITIIVAIFEKIMAKLCPRKVQLKADFEVAAFIRRYITHDKPSEIKFGGKNPPEGKLFLSSIPNKNSPEMREFFSAYKDDSHKLAWVSVNEKWEIVPQGESIPLTDKDYEDLMGSENRLFIESNDHEPVSQEEMTKAASFIDNQLSKGKDVGVNCRAGKGRSAMLVAAYLMKYQGLNVDQAIEAIESSRKGTTVRNKRAALEDFHKSLPKSPASI
ncbi:MAG: dual specificity protein phosphatase family protein [Verrucomicrobia bacterium]|nr:dual specificity protein phosphatase family protein [Verrucomicrobiota bacterium]